jgi:hypothetical protein
MKIAEARFHVSLALLPPALVRQPKFYASGSAHSRIAAFWSVLAPPKCKCSYPRAVSFEKEGYFKIGVKLGESASNFDNIFIICVL